MRSYETMSRGHSKTHRKFTVQSEYTAIFYTARTYHVVTNLVILKYYGCIDS